MNEVVQMLSTQKEKHHKEIEQLKDGFAHERAQLEEKLAEQQKQQMAQFQVLYFE
jgi:DNA-binding transcriptional MerR regulator